MYIYYIVNKIYNKKKKIRRLTGLYAYATKAARSVATLAATAHSSTFCQP